MRKNHNRLYYGKYRYKTVFKLPGSLIFFPTNNEHLLHIKKIHPDLPDINYLADFIIKYRHKMKFRFQDRRSIFYSDKNLAKKLIENGFDSVQKISQAEAESLEKIEELDIEISETLIERAEEALLEIALAEMDEESIEVEKDNTLESVESLKSEYIELLKTAGIKTKENLADLSSDELSPILDLNEDEAGKIIMDARADWFN